MKGGYVEVDATGFDFSVLGKVDGIYKKFLDAYHTDKLVVMCNAKNSGIRFTPIPVFLAMESTTIVVTIMNLPYRITTGDVITQE